MSDPSTRLNAALEGRYAIERELGEGGMATVYLADDLKHLRALAVNVLLLLTVLSGCSPPSQDAGRWELIHTLVGPTGWRDAS